MSNQSPLRKELESIEYPKIKGVNVLPENIPLTIGTLVPSETIDAILDVLIHALPKPLNEGQYSLANNHYDTALREVKQLLLEAKGDK